MITIDWLSDALESQEEGSEKDTVSEHAGISDLPKGSFTRHRMRFVALWRRAQSHGNATVRIISYVKEP